MNWWWLVGGSQVIVYRWLLGLVPSIGVPGVRKCEKMGYLSWKKIVAHFKRNKSEIIWPSLNFGVTLDYYGVLKSGLCVLNLPIESKLLSKSVLGTKIRPPHPEISLLSRDNLSKIAIKNKHLSIWINIHRIISNRQEIPKCLELFIGWTF